MIISGGENVYSPRGRGGAVRATRRCSRRRVRRPRRTWGEVVHAVVVPQAASALAERTLIAHCRPLIAGYKLPKAIEFRTEPLPKSGPGKVLKRSCGPRSGKATPARSTDTRTSQAFSAATDGRGFQRIRGNMRTKVLLDESRMPTQWYNVIPDLPSPPPPPLHPGTHEPRARRPRPAVPDGADRAGGHRRQPRRHPGRRARRVPPVAAEPALPGPPAQARARLRRGSTTSTKASALPARTSRTRRCRRRTTTTRRASPS